MFALADTSKFEGEKGACKILKPFWDVITNYLVLFLAGLSIAFVGMQLASGTFQCLAAVDCPGMSRENMSSSWFSHVKHHNACEEFYSTQKNRNIPSTVVVTDLEKSTFYANFVNSECSKSAIPNFLSYFGFVLSIQALALAVLDNLWFKLPVTASVIERFVSLVMECYESVSIASNNGSDDYESLDSKGHTKKSVHEKVDAFIKNLEFKCCKIWHLYSLQAILQAVLALVFLLIHISYMSDLKGTIKCTLTQHIPVAHDAFICSHNLAPAFVLGLKSLYLPALGITIGFFFMKILWTAKKRKKKFEYVFDKNKLPSLTADISPVDHDLGFLLHLLDLYDKSLVIKFAHFLREKTDKEREDYFLRKNGYPVEILVNKLTEPKRELVDDL